MFREEVPNCDFVVVRFRHALYGATGQRQEEHDGHAEGRRARQPGDPSRDPEGQARARAAFDPDRSQAVEGARAASAELAQARQGDRR